MFGRRDRELDEELRGHLEMATRDRIERGEDPAAAAAAARREFGNVAQVREVTRGMWGRTWLDRLAQDARYTARLLRRTPAFSCIAILSLAVGIGANAAIMQVISAVTLRALPVSRPHELVDIAPVSMEGARGNFSGWRSALPNPVWEQIRDQQQAFAGTFAWGAQSFNLATGGEARPAQGLWVSGSFFDVLGLRPAHGRLLAPHDDTPGCPARAVISERFWQREFGGARAIVGQTMTLDAHTVEIVGVAPAGFFGLEVGRSFDVALPICAEPALAGGPSRLASGTDWWLIVMGRLSPGAGVEQASGHLATLSPGIFKATLAPHYPQVSVPKYLAMTLQAVPTPTGVSYLREQYSAPLWLLLALATVVLLIACANLANLMLARGRAREREIAIRLGLGASRGRVVRQLLTESLVLSMAGAALGLVLAQTFSDALVAFVDADQQSVVLNLALDWRVVGFAAALAGLTCLLFGLTPALRATRVGSASVLKAAGRTVTAAPDGSATRRVLVVTQVALSLVLVVGALLFTRTVRNLDNVDPGFAREGILVARIDIRRLAVAPEQRTAFKQSLLERLRGVPGVDGAAAAAIVPVSGSAWGNDVTVQGAAGPVSGATLFNRVSDGYFTTFRTPLIAGRDFTDADTPGAPRVAIVNRAFVRHFFGGATPIGARFTVEPTPSSPATAYEIVGVAADAKYLTLREDIRPAAYLPMSQEGGPSNRWAQIALRSSGDLSALAGGVSRRLQEIDPAIGVSYTVLGDEIARTMVLERLLARLSAFFGAIAAALALIGLYGVIAYTVARRTNEIGVRIALGATPAAIVRMVLGEGVALVATGTAVGLGLALASGTFARAWLFGLEPGDPATIATAACLLGSVALLASYLPARSAARIDPLTALRVD